MKVQIITDSTSDISPAYAREKGISLLPIGIEIDGQFFLEGVDITNPEFYEKISMSTKMPHTSQINEYQFDEIIKSQIKTNTFFLILPISKELSNTYYTAKAISEKYPKENIYVCDTKTTTVGLAMLVDYALRLSKENISTDEFIAKIENYKERICVYGMIGDLKYLKMGGRLSAGSAVIGSIMKITPIVIIDGKVKVIAKHIGKNKCYNQLAQLASQRDKLEPVYIGHSNRKNLIDTFISKEYQTLCLNNYKIFELGAAIGTHTGPGCMAIAFIKK